MPIAELSAEGGLPNADARPAISRGAAALFLFNRSNFQPISLTDEIARGKFSEDGGGVTILTAPFAARAAHLDADGRLFRVS
jgi:hypothetical protein